MEPHTPLVSVIMPAYNTGTVIGEALDGLLRQTWTDWELIVVNDGSTDATADVVRRYADQRIHLISFEQNRGNPEASNAGLREARGKYIVIMDSDDVSFPDRIERQVRYLETHDVDGCGSGHVIMTSIPAVDRFKRWLVQAKSRFVPAEEVACGTLFGGSVYNPTMCFRRSLLATIPVWRDPRFRSGSDDIFYNRLIAAGARLVVLPEVFLRYRRLRNSNSRRFKAAAWNNRAKTALEAVHRLIPETTQEQETLHALVVHRDSALAPEHIPGIQRWFSQLVEANREKQLFDEPALLRCLARHWQRACAIAGCRNLKAGLRAYSNFPLLRPYTEQTLDFLYEWQKRKLGRRRGPAY